MWDMRLAALTLLRLPLLRCVVVDPKTPISPPSSVEDSRPGLFDFFISLTHTGVVLLLSYPPINGVLACTHAWHSRETHYGSFSEQVARAK